MQESIDVPGWVDYHGPATPEDLREKWFPMAHGMITLSRHSEGRPPCCAGRHGFGTFPSSRYAQPAHENILKHATTGWLVESPAELRAGIDALSEPDEKAIRN